MQNLEEQYKSVFSKFLLLTQKFNNVEIQTQIEKSRIGELEKKLIDLHEEKNICYQLLFYIQEKYSKNILKSYAKEGIKNNDCSKLYSLFNKKLSIQLIALASPLFIQAVLVLCKETAKTQTDLNLLEERSNELY